MGRAGFPFARGSDVVALCLLTAALSMGVVAPSSSAPSKWCSENGDSPPCVQSARRDSGPPVTDSTDPNWDVDFLVVSPGHVMATVFNKAAGSEDLGSAELSHHWAVTIHVGTTVPRVVFATADNVTVHRGAGPDYRVTVTGTPVTETQGCDQSLWPWSCADPPADQLDAIFSAEITDYHEWQAANQRNSMYGMNYWTNVDATDIPPQFGPDPNTGLNRIVLDLANSHHYQNGTTVFTGLAHLRIPNSFLKTVYGIDDPATLTSAGIAPSGAGPSASVSIAEGDGNTALFVDITGMTFSARRVTMKTRSDLAHPAGQPARHPHRQASRSAVVQVVQAAGFPDHGLPRALRVRLLGGVDSPRVAGDRGDRALEGPGVPMPRSGTVQGRTRGMVGEGHNASPPVDPMERG